MTDTATTKNRPPGRPAVQLDSDMQDVLDKMRSVYAEWAGLKHWRDIEGEKFDDLEIELMDLIATARGLKCTWRHIGSAMGMQRSGALRWFNAHV